MLPRIKLSLLVVAVAAMAMSIVNVERGTAAESSSECKEKEATRPASSNAPDLIELQANSVRPTVDIGLADKTSGGSEIAFRPKAGQRFGPQVAAELIDRPRSGTHDLRGKAFVAARPSESGRVVVVAVCLEGVRHWDAGRYEGAIAVYGPRLADFSYALVVTVKWPWWVAVGAIAGTVLFSAVILVLVRQPTRSVWSRRGAVATGLGFLVGALLAGFTYWSNYVSSDTWGDDPQAQIVALVMASFSATVIGLGTVRAALTRLESGGEGDPQAGGGEPDDGAS